MPGRPEIGGWQMAHAKELATAPGMFPRWSTLVDMEPGPFEYKYVWQHSHGEAEWESTANRSYLGTDGPFCTDGEFNHNECVQKPGSYVSHLQVQAIVSFWYILYLLMD